MIPAPTKFGFWKRKVRPCHCKLFEFQNPHGWVKGYCPPEPMAPRANAKRRGIDCPRQCVERLAHWHSIDQDGRIWTHPA